MTDSDKKYSYARFWKCALQVNPHSYANEFRGDKENITEGDYNQLLLDECKKNDIKVVGIADHGNVESIDSIRDLFNQNGIIVFPGFEIASTEKIHMVCLFPEITSITELNRYLGELGLTDPGQKVMPSKYSCIELGKKIVELGGFWYAAHMTGDNGLLKLQQDGGGLHHIWKEEQWVIAGQLPGSKKELEQNYQQIIENKNPDYKRKKPIIVINAKDIAKPSDLSITTATCLIKMTTPCFEAFKLAFLDPESRVRLNSEQVEHYYGSIEKIAFKGGYLDGVEIELSENLNTFIGGRGTGKSTLIESIRYALDKEPKSKEAIRTHQSIVQANLGKESSTVEIWINSYHQKGQKYKISRRFGDPPIIKTFDRGFNSGFSHGDPNITKSDSGEISNLDIHDLLPGIEIYGQNELLEIVQDQQAINRVLERFLPDTSQIRQRQEELERLLKENAYKLITALTEWEEIESKVANLPRLLEQQKTFNDLGIDAKLVKTRLIAREDTIFKRIDEEIAGLKQGLGIFNESLPDLTFLSDTALKDLPNQSILLDIKNSFSTAVEKCKPKLAEIEKLIEDLSTNINKNKENWKEEVTKIREELNKSLQDLPEMAGKSGREIGTEYQHLQNNIEQISSLKTLVDNKKKLADELKRKRNKLLVELRETRDESFKSLQQAIKQLNKKQLKGKLEISMIAWGVREPLKEFLLQLEGIGEKKLAWIDNLETFSIATFVQSIRGGVDQLLDDYKAHGMSTGVAEILTTKLSRQQVMELEALEIPDRIDIKLNVSQQGENYKSLNQLSKGQQCTAILQLLLLDNKDPLIIDQPEDNLDNAFISDRIVTELRKGKNQRQFIFATHNANIPVFGDAEGIGILREEDSRGIIDEGSLGSIDVPTVRQQVADILEGGREAFEMRKLKYNY
jgi:ABC-type lipoprotein export system ATPase subunit